MLREYWLLIEMRIHVFEFVHSTCFVFSVSALRSRLFRSLIRFVYNAKSPMPNLVQ